VTTFYLGTHMPHWLERTNVPLFVSHRRLSGRRTMPRARGPWALDSGGFTELSMFGEWRTGTRTYVSAVRRYAAEIGNLAWASPQDWMCEPGILEKTGLTVADHQRRTVDNYLRLRDLAADLPFVPVLQGWQLDDYRRHVDTYTAAGVDLHAEPTVGVGSVCRRQHTGQIEQVLAALAAEGLRLHGFGLKVGGLRAGAHHLASADSMAWSARGRRVQPPTCGSITHKSEANCLTFALDWRDHVLDVIDEPKQLAFAVPAGA
jgi:hypothetical protein